MANFTNYQGDLRLYSGDQGKWLKIWSLLDYPVELTALDMCSAAVYKNSLSTLDSRYPSINSD